MPAYVKVTLVCPWEGKESLLILLRTGQLHLLTDEIQLHSLTDEIHCAFPLDVCSR